MRRHELPCRHPHRQPRSIRSWNRANLRLRTPRGDRAVAGHRLDDVGRHVRGGTGSADRNSSSWPAAHDRLRPLRNLRQSAGAQQGEFSASAKAGDFIHVPAFLPHMEINPSEHEPFLMDRRAEHGNADRRQSSGRRLALSLAEASLHRTLRTPDFANMEQSWTITIPSTSKSRDARSSRPEPPRCSADRAAAGRAGRRAIGRRRDPAAARDGRTSGSTVSSTR